MTEDRIRVSFMLNYPHANENCSRLPHREGSSCQLPGIAVEIIQLIASYLNLTIDVIKVSPYISGKCYREYFKNL